MDSNKTYKVMLSKTADKQLGKLNKTIGQQIFSWIKQNLDGCEDPRQYGKALTGDYKGKWRYRIGDYRVIADIQDDIITILILEIGHRKEIYK